MRLRRYAPLVNVGAAIFGTIETVGSLLMGDFQRAIDSGAATAFHAYDGVRPYAETVSSKINTHSMIGNSVAGITSYMWLYLKEYYKKPSRSISLTFFPIVALVQNGTNLTELMKHYNIVESD